MNDSVSIEFIIDYPVIEAKLKKIKSTLTGLTKTHLPILAYTVLLDAALSNIRQASQQLFCLPFPWEVTIDFPSHPTLIADARHFCQTAQLAEKNGIIVDSFAQWRLFKKQEIFCCCGRATRGRTVPIEIVIHHPVRIDRSSRTLEIKQLIGIRSADQQHIEGHYNLHKASRVDHNISIIRSSTLLLSFPAFQLLSKVESGAQQFNLPIFEKMFVALCTN